MGWFGGDEVVKVSSGVYNLAGDINLRPNYLKSLIIGGILGNTGKSISETIVEGFLHGPAPRLRKMSKWAQTSGYNATVGALNTTFSLINRINTSTVASQIPKEADQIVEISSTDIGPPNIRYWVDDWVLKNFPEDINSAYDADVNDTTYMVTVTIPGHSQTYQFMPEGYNRSGQYLYVLYRLARQAQSFPVIEGDLEDLDPDEEFPSLGSEWNLVFSEITTETAVLTTTVQTIVTYSDETPGSDETVTTTEEQEYEKLHETFRKYEYLGQTVDPVTGESQSRGLYTFIQHYQGGVIVPGESVEEVETEELEDDVIKTTTTITTVDTFLLTKQLRQDTQEVITQSWTPLTTMIYRRGTGNPVLDSLFLTVTPAGSEYFPFIPVRAHNFYVRQWLPALGEACDRAYRKLTGASLTKLEDSLNQNPSLGNIDSIYVQFGASLNTKEMSARKYIYLFFNSIADGAFVGGDDRTYAQWKAAHLAANVAMENWVNWRIANQSGDINSPWWGISEPPKATYPALPFKSVRVSSLASLATSFLHYDQAISWNFLSEESGFGLAAPGVKVGDVWFQVAEWEELPVIDVVYYGGGDVDITIGKTERTILIQGVRLYHQETANSWKALHIVGLLHANRVYNSYAVNTYGSLALLDTEESPFIIPLHNEIFKRMRLRDSNQMATACCYLVMNSYTVYYTKWYESGLFKVILVIVIAIIAVYTGYADVGLLGTSASVGASLGFVGTTALIVGAVANALAAMILTTIIQEASVALFGEKIGSIIGAIASIVAINVGTAMSMGTSIAESFSGLLSADNILRLTQAVGDGYTGYINAATKDVMLASEELARNAEASSEVVSRLYSELVGGDRAMLNPLEITNTLGTFYEPPSSFLTRTLLTGSEVADLSLGMLNNFADITLSTDII